MTASGTPLPLDMELAGQVLATHQQRFPHFRLYVHGRPIEPSGAPGTAIDWGTAIPAHDRRRIVEVFSRYGHADAWRYVSREPSPESALQSVDRRWRGGRPSHFDIRFVNPFEWDDSDEPPGDRPGAAPLPMFAERPSCPGCGTRHDYSFHDR